MRHVLRALGLASIIVCVLASSIVHEKDVLVVALRANTDKD